LRGDLVNELFGRVSVIVAHDTAYSDRIYGWVKNFEGFGYTIIQSLAKGRPVFLKRSFSEGQKLMNWCVNNQTALFFDDSAQFSKTLNCYLYDETYRVNLQNNAARQIRRMINNERQALIFENFIQNLK